MMKYIVSLLFLTCYISIQAQCTDGDIILNGDFESTRFPDCSTFCRGFEDDVLLMVNCIAAAPRDENLCLPVTTKNFEEIASLQTGILWNPSLLKFSSINEVALADITINQSRVEQGFIRILWIIGFSADPVTLDDDSVLFEICFDVLADEAASAEVALVSAKNFQIELATINGLSPSVCAQSGQINIGNPAVTGNIGVFNALLPDDWVTMDIAFPVIPQAVDCSGSYSIGHGFDSITPLDGNCMFVNGFDGRGPGKITMHQEVLIPMEASSATFAWSEWLAWDLITFPGSNLDRMFEVQVQSQGGGPPLEILYSVTAPARTQEFGTGWVSHTADLSAYAGQTIWLCFVEDIPERFTGPAQAAIDGVSLNIECPTQIPTMGEWGIICLSLLFMILGVNAIRQHQAGLVKV